MLFYVHANQKEVFCFTTLAYQQGFVSSTFTDMLPYREAIRSAIDRANCKAVGMERFGAASIPSLEKCLEELKTCQIYVCAIGMRYGSIDKESQMSYT